MKIQTSFPVQDPSHAGDARRRTLSICKALDLTESETGRIGLVVTELATNLAKHAGQGELLILGDTHEGIPGIDILSLDRGPGMANLSRNMRDGYSTVGSLGTGLGAIFRNSDYFDIHSEPGKGTVILSRFRRGASYGSFPEGQTFEVGGITMPATGEEECGDGWDALQTGRECLVFVSDGLGHGPDAALASRQAISLFEINRAQSLPAIAEAIHRGLHGTRGAVVALARMETREGMVRYCGIGNISGCIITDSSTKNMISENGTAGYNVRKIREYDYAWQKNSILVMNSDGLVAHWKLDGHGTLESRHPLVIAGVLYRDYRRGRDDVTVVVAKEIPPGHVQETRQRFSPNGTVLPSAGFP